nr:putative Polycomb group protein ASXL3 [Ipomoea batatas]
MSGDHEGQEEEEHSLPPPPPPPKTPLLPPPTASSLYKQNTWSPETFRDEVWQRRKENHGKHLKRRSKSVTDEDLNELKACIELGFGFDSPEMDQRLSETFPAYSLFYSVNKHLNDTVSKTATASDCDTSSSVGSPDTMFGPGERPEIVKTRLKRWAQVVACSLRQSSN